MSKFVLGPVRSWSFSALQTYEKCPYNTKLKSVDKLAGPVREADNPMERGNRIHKAAEDYIMGKDHHLDPALAKHMSAHYAAMRNMYTKGVVTVEEEWCYDFELNQTGWKDKSTWLRAKLDCGVHLSDDEFLVQDHKTGKLFGNEVKHASQGMFYAGLASVRYPEIAKFHVEFWYPDVNELTRTTFTRRQSGIFLAKFMERGKAMTSAIDFPAKPSEPNCRYCEYGKNKGVGACEYDYYRRSNTAKVEPTSPTGRKSIL